MSQRWHAGLRPCDASVTAARCGDGPIAYGFMLAGLFVLVRVRRDRVAGLLLGAAVLARHSYVLIVIPALLAAWGLGLLNTRRVVAIGWGASAAVLPLVVFITAFGFWRDFLALSVTVNQALLAAIGEWTAVPSSMESDEIFPDEPARRRRLLRRGTAAVITPPPCRECPTRPSRLSMPTRAFNCGLRSGVAEETRRA